MDLLDDYKNIKNIIDDNLPQILPLVRYLEIEALNKKLNLRAPPRILTNDIYNFDEKFIDINEMMETIEINFNENQIL